MTDVETVPALLERLRVGDEAPGETLSRVLLDAVALKVLEEAMRDRCGHTFGCSMEVGVSGNGDNWGVLLEGEVVGALEQAGCPAASLGLALRSAAEAVGKGEA
jgi:hypothetical protein